MRWAIRIFFKGITATDTVGALIAAPAEFPAGKMAVAGPAGTC